MSNWALTDSLRTTPVGSIPATSQGTLATSSSANTKTGYTQLTASWPFECSGFWVEEMLAPSGGFTVLYDIAIGGSGSETVLVPNVFTYSLAPTRWWCPMAIRAGERVSFRFQDNQGSNSFGLILHPVAIGPSSLPGFSRCATYGADTANSLGTGVDPGGSSETKGSWTQFSSSVGFDIKVLKLRPYQFYQDYSPTHGHIFDIGVGGSGSEATLISNVQFYARDWSDCNPDWVEFRTDIPRTTRLTLRAQTNDTTAPSGVGVASRQWYCEMLAFG